MKTNHMHIISEILLLVAVTIITCVLVFLGFNALNSAKSLSKIATDQIIELNNELKDGEIKKYDDIDVDGSEVINCIKKYLGDYESPDIAPIYVYVKTNLSENTYANKSSISKTTNFTDTAYIKPKAIFHGKVLKNKNAVIVGISFIQV
jgi:hypothetical protein